MLEMKSSKNHIFDFSKSLVCKRAAQDLLRNLGNNKDPYQMHLTIAEATD